MKRHFRLLVQYFAQYAKVRLAYKADFIIAFFSSMAATVLGFGFVLVLFSKIPRLQDWSFNEVMFLYGFSLIPLGFFNVISWNLYDFSEIYVIEGKFDRVLLRPVSTLFQVVFEKFRLESLQEVVTGIVVVAICVHRLHLTLRIPDYLWFVVMIVCGAAIYLAVFLILTAVSFWFEDRVGIVPPVFNMLTFRPLPLDHLQRLHSVFAELDHSLWLRHVLSHHPLPGAKLFRPVFPSGARGRGRVLGAGDCGLEPRGGQLQQHGNVAIALRGCPVKPTEPLVGRALHLTPIAGERASAPIPPFRQRPLPASRVRICCWPEINPHQETADEHSHRTGGFVLLSLIPAHAQRSKPAIVAEGGQPDDRASARVLYWNTVKNGAAGQFAINYGRPVWKSVYEDPANFDRMTKGKIWRMGSNFWTALDTCLPLKISGKDVPAGYYYLGLHRSEDGSKWSLAFIDPAKVRAAHLDAFQIEKPRWRSRFPCPSPKPKQNLKSSPSSCPIPRTTFTRSL